MKSALILGLAAALAVSGAAGAAGRHAPRQARAPSSRAAGSARRANAFGAGAMTSGSLSAGAVGGDSGGGLGLGGGRSKSSGASLGGGLVTPRAGGHGRRSSSGL